MFFFFTFIIACFHLVYISNCTGFQVWTVILKKKKKKNFKICRLANPMAPRRGPWLQLVGDFLFSKLTPEGITKLEGEGATKWVLGGTQTTFLTPMWGGMLIRENRMKKSLKISTHSILRHLLAKAQRCFEEVEPGPRGRQSYRTDL